MACWEWGQAAANNGETSEDISAAIVVMDKKRRMRRLAIYARFLL